MLKEATLILLQNYWHIINGVRLELLYIMNMGESFHLTNLASLKQKKKFIFYSK